MNLKLMKNFRLFLLIISLIFLSSCSICTDFYIQNLRNEDQHILIKYKVPIKNWPDYRTIKFQYINELKIPKEFDKIENKNIVDIKQIDDYTVEFIVPKQSTVRIERTSNTRYYEYLKSFQLNGKDILLDDLISQSKTKGPHRIYQIN